MKKLERKPGQPQGYELTPVEDAKILAKATPVQKLGLGSAAEGSFRKLGITRARYKLFKKYLGLDPACGCEYRREVLNCLGELFEQYRKDHSLVSAMLHLPAMVKKAKNKAEKGK